MMRNATKGAALAGLLLAGMALGGCLPPEEETLGAGSLPPYSVTFDFTGGMPAEFIAMSAGFEWAYSAADANCGSDCLQSAAVNNLEESCVGVFPSTIINFVQYTYGNAGGSTSKLTLYVDSTEAMVTSVVHGISVTPTATETTFPAGIRSLVWCETGDPIMDGVGRLDDVTYGIRAN